MWAWVNRVAYDVSGEKRFLREFQRLDSLFGSMPTAQQTNFGLGREKYISTEDRAFHDKEVVVANSLIDMEPQSRIATSAPWPAGGSFRKSACETISSLTTTLS